MNVRLARVSAEVGVLASGKCDFDYSGENDRLASGYQFDSYCYVWFDFRSCGACFHSSWEI